MRILCLNAWGGRLYDDLVAYLVATDPDVVCLQEVVHAPAAPGAWLDYRDDGAQLVQRADLYRDIGRALPGHLGVFSAAAQGELWDGEARVMSHWGLASYVRASLPVSAQMSGFVHGGFHRRGFGPHPRARTGQVLRLQHPDLGPVTVAHMHGLRDPAAGKQDTPARAAQAGRFADLIRAVAGPDDPVVACGDFNVLPDSATFAVLARLGLRDLVAGGGFTDTRSSHYAKSPRFADYMLVNDAVAVRDFQVVAAPEVSDHRPLLLTL
ncbi:MAG: endonuclease/exonuclease/phosphatase family protein [Pseudomonadota bacterium]